MQRSAGPRIKLELTPDHTRNNYELHWKWSRIKFEIIPNLTEYVTGLNKNDSGSNSQRSWIKLDDSGSNSKKFRIKLEKILDQTGNDPRSNWIITDPSGIEPGSNMIISDPSGIEPRSNWKYSGTKKGMFSIRFELIEYQLLCIVQLPVF